MSIIGKKQIYVVGDNKVKVGAKGKAQPVDAVLASVTKGEARKIRRALRKMGRSDLSAIRRCMDNSKEVS